MDNGQDTVCWMPVREFLDILLPTSLEPSSGLERRPKLELKDADPSEGLNEEQDLHCTLLTALAENLRSHAFQRPAVSIEESWCADIATYLEQGACSRDGHVTDNSLVDLGHTVIMHDFGVATNGLTDSSRSPDARKVLWRSKSAQLTVQRISRNIARVLNRQHRTHAFHVVITPLIARLLRMDRCGLVISEPIPISEDASDLFEFYERYQTAPVDMRGFDPTVHLASAREITAAKPFLEEWAPLHCGTHPFYAFDVPNPGGSCRRVIGWEPLAVSDSLASRATRPYAVYDVESKKVLFLKDFWREDDVNCGKESDILRELNENGVEHVPILFAGDDVPGLYQRTLTQQFKSATWRKGTLSKLFPRIHHRILEEFLPQSISAFKTPHDMLQFAHHAIIAHQQAYERCQILHRDISVNNLRIRGGSEGVLADWDLAVKLNNRTDTVPASKSNPHRIGTWKFLSVALALEPEKENSFQDDIESIYWVILHLSLTYVPFTTKRKASYSDIVKAIFNEHHRVNPGDPIGGFHKREVIRGSSYAERLEFTNNQSLTRWFHATSQILDRLYRYRLYQQHLQEMAEFGISSPPSPVAYPTAMDNHEAFVSLMTQYLNPEGWSDNKTNNKYPPKDVCGSSGHKRSRNDEEEGVFVSSKKSKLSDDAGPAMEEPIVDAPPSPPASFKPAAEVEQPLQPTAHVYSKNGPRPVAEKAGAFAKPVNAPKLSKPRRTSRQKQNLEQNKIAIPRTKSMAKEGKTKQQAPPPTLGMTLRSADKGKKTSDRQSTKALGPKSIKTQPLLTLAKTPATGPSKKEMGVTGRMTARQLALAHAKAAKKNAKTTTSPRKSKRKQQ